MKFVLFQGQNNQWFWRLVAGNGQIIAIGGEGYVNRADAVHGIQLVRGNAPNAAAYDWVGNHLQGV